MTVRVPAKVNLQLSVGPRRDDGYHDLVNVFHAVSLFDEVTAWDAPRQDTAGPGVTASGEAGSVDGSPDGSVSVAVEGESAARVPLDGGNLAVKAAVALAARAGRRPDVRLRIRKSIPVAGGMAGGSADAAAALVACDALWGLGSPREELMEIAAELGSDVPFALFGGTAVGTGRGEKLTRVPVAGRFHWVFALAEGGLSTAEVYGECDRLREATGEQVGWPSASDDLMAALAIGDAKALGAVLSNDLQPAALLLCRPLARTLAAGREHGALGALVSGSGPTCAFLAESEDHATTLATALEAAGVCRTAVTASGPVPGAEIV
ncbi:4-(cytidine 5'-diphospho)-2-C-methyl-D-erythritol kinase [Sphaerisporangium album]|uniref:4-(cytidine 5'-diphospho)-2-C-methyl-D-erythritol kinase n=1 Tax=Sphaerisporangium album TaxID=509200 RepID=UPI001C68B188|nr:4-(cytidine 5'-diphospho)-2-C-methyl-D-erythritol kinase [Sphaerisporangium album]